MTRGHSSPRYVRPTLEYASTIWSPSRITQIIFIEGVQRSFTKRLPGLANLSYSERIKILKLQSLEHRRLLLDLVQTFKKIHNLSSLKFADFFSYPTYNSTRGHSHRLAVPIFKSDVKGKKFFGFAQIPRVSLAEVGGQFPPPAPLPHGYANGNRRRWKYQT